MCGIAGIYHLTGETVDLMSVRRMADIMRHRGPDDEGYALIRTTQSGIIQLGGPNTPIDINLPSILDYGDINGVDLVLAQRRLAIIDISVAGHGPMCSDGGLCITFNGEIYNYIELRNDLINKGHIFRTKSDTEVILHAYTEWGVDCVRRFNGMWAFVIWDGPRRRLVCSRDRLGVKPFYYHLDNEMFVFASEMKSIWGAGICQGIPDKKAVSLYIAGYTRSDPASTMLLGINQLLPGHNLILENGSYAIQPYWQLESNEEFYPKEPEQIVVDNFLELLIDAVRLRLRSDVPVGTCLSGGVDSSSIVQIINRLMIQEHIIDPALIGEHQKTFSACYQNSDADESEYINIVLESTGSEGHFVYPSADNLREDFDKLVYSQDEPFDSTSIYAQYCVMRLAHQAGITVLLDGQGADELLGGYTPYDTYLRQAILQSGIRSAIKEIGYIHRISNSPIPNLLMLVAFGLFPANVRKLLRTRHSLLSDYGLNPDMHPFIRERQGEIEDKLCYNNLNKLLADQELNTLSRLLHYEDRNSMAHSVEGRTPFVDYRIVEFAFQQPACYKIHAGWTKWLLRQAVSSIIPAEIAWRRDKKGFETPEQNWIHELIYRSEPLSNKSPANEFLDLTMINQVIKQMSTSPGDRRSTRQAWRWLNLMSWLKILSTQSQSLR